MIIGFNENLQFLTTSNFNASTNLRQLKITIALANRYAFIGRFLMVATNDHVLAGLLPSSKSALNLRSYDCGLSE
jgi:hypothetical protein